VADRRFNAKLILPDGTEKPSLIVYYPPTLTGEEVEAIGRKILSVFSGRVLSDVEDEEGRGTTTEDMLDAGVLDADGVQEAPAPKPPQWPAGLLDRIKAAEQRIADNHAPRRIPADPHGDVDLVLAEVRYLIEGCWPPFWIKDAAGVGGTPNDLRQVREDSQGLGEPGRLSPTSGVAADPAPQERELVGWQFRYVFEDQGNRRAAWGCVLQGAPSFTSGYRSYNGWQRRYFHEVRRVYADPVEPYVEDPHHKPDTSGVPEGHASARNFPGADDVAGVAPVEATSTKPCPECSGGNPGLLDDGSGGFSTCDECGGTGTIGVDASRGGEQ
jgi:hypothetical protein